MSNSTGQEQQTNTAKKKPAERVCPLEARAIVPEAETYHEMLDFERKLDLNISKRTLDIQESIHGSPSWELRVEGRLIDEKDTRPAKRKFSSFFKSLVIELDSNLYGPDNHLVEWHRTANTTETDGFQVRRHGGLPVKCTILLHLEHQPPHFKVDPRLARVLGKQTGTRSAIISSLWQYIKNKQLQDNNDRESIINDKYLKSILECKRMKFSDIPLKLNHLLSPTDPIVIEHLIVRGFGDTQRSIYEIDVEVEDKSLNSQKDSLGAFSMPPSSVQELQQLDDKLCDTLEAIKLTRNTFDLFTSFANDPHRFAYRWLATQSKDLKLTTDQKPGDSEDERQAVYYYQPWLQEAVCRYFYRKLQERRGDLEPS